MVLHGVKKNRISCGRRARLIEDLKKCHSRFYQAHKLESSTKTRCSLANCITNWSSAQPVKVSARSESFNRKWLIKLRQLQHRLNHHRHLQTVKSLLTSFRLVLTPIHHQSQFVHKIVSIVKRCRFRHPLPNMKSPHSSSLIGLTRGSVPTILSKDNLAPSERSKARVWKSSRSNSFPQIGWHKAN